MFEQLGKTKRKPHKKLKLERGESIQENWAEYSMEFRGRAGSGKQTRAKVCSVPHHILILPSVSVPWHMLGISSGHEKAQRFLHLLNPGPSLPPTKSSVGSEHTFILLLLPHFILFNTPRGISGLQITTIPRISQVYHMGNITKQGFEPRNL